MFPPYWGKSFWSFFEKKKLQRLTDHEIFNPDACQGQFNLATLLRNTLYDIFFKECKQIDDIVHLFIHDLLLNDGNGYY